MNNSLLFLRRLIMLLIVALSPCAGMAYHIVGGEIEFITLEPGRYRINLVQYFDKAQTDNPNPDGSVEIYMFSSSDDVLIRTFFINTLVSTPVEYTNVECSRDELQTLRVVYTADFELNPQDFNDPNGYYLSWERCCRNGNTKNFPVNPTGTGMNYVLDIPPLWKNDQPYINSSPILLKPLNDYACINQLYYTSFTGTDPDGDSLSYRLVTPLNSSSNSPVPIPQPRPHINLNYAQGYSLTNMITGSPPLRISNSGLLTVAPFETGLYILSVMVEEWRDGEKIGQVQRDFQMLVVDGCDPPDPPDVGIRIPGNPDFDNEVDTLFYALAEDKCFEFFVTNITAGETISLRAEPVNFDEDIDGLFSITSAPVGAGLDTLRVEVCAPGCPPVRNGPFIIDLIAGDDACPLPQLDTARLIISVEPPPNEFPELAPLLSRYQVEEGGELSIDLVGTDADDDLIDARIFIPGIDNPQEYGFSLTITETEAGRTEAFLHWDANCLLYNFGNQNLFPVGIILEDADQCEVENPEINWVELEVLLPPNTLPVLNTTTSLVLTAEPGEVVEFTVFVTDADMDMVDLYMVTEGFDAASVGVDFAPASGEGEAVSVFTWPLDCDRLGLNDRTDFEFIFLANDEDKCRVQNFDSLRVNVEVDWEENLRPDFASYADTVLEVNTPFSLDISAFDANSADELTLEFFDPSRLPSSPSLAFERARGIGLVNSTLEWTPECDLLDFGETSAFFDLTFLVYDDGCPQQLFNTMTLTVEVRETRERFEGFDPPNVFTPNGDGRNDTYTLTNLPVRSYNLPPDNCDDAFQYITILDRTGKKVFETTNREFEWDGANVESGTYYYLIRYTRTDYKGYLQVLR